jgi:hypothetical protein
VEKLQVARSIDPGTEDPLASSSSPHRSPIFLAPSFSWCAHAMLQPSHCYIWGCRMELAKEEKDLLIAACFVMERVHEVLTGTF